jgi:hypothetical protein
LFDLATRRPRPALRSDLRALVPIIVKLGGCSQHRLRHPGSWTLVAVDKHRCQSKIEKPGMTQRLNFVHIVFALFEPRLEMGYNANILSKRKAFLMQPKPTLVDLYACGIYPGQPAVIPDSIAGRALFGDLAGAMRPIQAVNQEL